MIDKIKIFKNKLYSLITIKDKQDIQKVLFLGFIVGLFELIGLALIVLMIQIFTNPLLIKSNSILRYLYKNIVSNDITYFIILVSFLIFAFYILKLIISIFNAKLMANISSNLYIDISKKLFKNYLSYYYRDFANKNTAEINQMLIVESDNLALTVSNVIFLIIHLMIIVLLYCYMLYTDLILTISITIFFILIIYLYKKLLNNKLIIMGEERINAVSSYMKFIKSTFSNYKFIKGLNGVYIENNLSNKTSDYKKARVDMLFWSETPRLLLEFIIITMMIGIFTFIKLKYTNTEDLLLIVSAYALALFRMLPSLSRVLNSINIINMYKKTLDLVHIEFQTKKELKCLTRNKIRFNNFLKLNNVSFHYPYSKHKSLNNLNITIKKGNKVCIVGASGSGKSTLMDILIGLHLPSDGKFLIDTKEINSNNIVNWRTTTSFVPQKVVLFESTVKENITFGKKYDEKLFREVLEDTYMYDVVMSKGGIDTKIGDEISGFSGGQMQRLVLARALYQEREILFLDEATSSLNEEIERKIFDRILKKYREKTIIAIIHKKSLLNKFDMVLRLKGGEYVKE